MQLNWLTFEKRINFYTFPIRFKSLKYQAPNITLFTPRVQQFCGWPAANFNISYKHKLSKHENVSDFTQFIGAFWVPCDPDTNFSLPLYMSREFKLHEWNLVNKQQERIMWQRGKGRYGTWDWCELHQLTLEFNQNLLPERSVLVFSVVKRNFNSHHYNISHSCFKGVSSGVDDVSNIHTYVLYCNSLKELFSYK